MHNDNNKFQDIACHPAKRLTTKDFAVSGKVSPLALSLTGLSSMNCRQAQ